MRGHALRHSIVILGLVLLASVGALYANKGNVDELRIGTALDASGEVDVKTNANNFPPNVPLFASMRVQETPAGTVLMLTLLDRETEETIYSAKQPVEHGHTNQHFKIPAEKLNAGKYRMKVNLGEDLVAEDEFEIDEIK